MFRFVTVSAALGAFLMVAQPSYAQRFFHRPRAVVVSPYFGYGYGPGWYGWSDPYWSAYAVRPTGEVKIVTHMKDASVYVDGGYAGVTSKLKHFDLMPGNHNIELRDTAGKTLLQQQVQVIRDKTTEIHVD
ncbi:MAG TPA: PEGA domain-containing protein [Terriglobia bacterium]|jgi:hypothetical protein